MKCVSKLSWCAIAVILLLPACAHDKNATPGPEPAPSDTYAVPDTQVVVEPAPDPKIVTVTPPQETKVVVAPAPPPRVVTVTPPPFRPKTDEGRRIMALIGEGDSNRDGVLTMEEWQRMRGRMRPRHFLRLDHNHDSVLSQGDAR